MIHYISKNNKEYYIIQTTFEAADIQVPIQIHINVTGLNEQAKFIIHRNSSIFLNRPLKATPPKSKAAPAPSKKPWWKIW